MFIKMNNKAKAFKETYSVESGNSSRWLTKGAIYSAWIL